MKKNMSNKQLYDLRRMEVEFGFSDLLSDSMPFPQNGVKLFFFFFRGMGRGLHLRKPCSKVLDAFHEKSCHLECQSIETSQIFLANALKFAHQETAKTLNYWANEIMSIFSMVPTWQSWTLMHSRLMHCIRISMYRYIATSCPKC